MVQHFSDRRLRRILRQARLLVLVVAVSVVPVRVALAVFAAGRTLTIDATQVSGSGGALSDFPVLVRLTDRALKTTGNGGQVTNANGYDIIFRANDALTCNGPAPCTLDHEIESYDGVTGLLLSWVRIPRLSQDVDTVITMYYGDPTVVVSTENVPGVWDTNFKGVWHLKEDPSGPAPQFFESTSNPNDGTANALSTVNQVPGQIDGSLEFDDTNERHVNVPDDPSLQLATDLTVSAWIRTTDSDAFAAVIANKWLNGGNKNYWLGKLDGSSIAFQLDNDLYQVTAPLTLVNDGQWHHVAGVARGTSMQMRIFVDGVMRNTAFFDGVSETGTSPFQIGKSADVLTQTWLGRIDEVRVSNRSRSEPWLQTSYTNQNATFPFFKPTVHFRSVGTNAGVIYSTGNASVSAGSTTVTLGGGANLPLPSAIGAVGRGDELVIGGETFHVVLRDSATQLTVDHAAEGNHAAQAYTITRAFGGATALQDWETGRDGDLIAANRIEIGLAYKDGPFLAGGATILDIDGSTTDASHLVKLMTAPGQGHDGTAGTGVVIDGAGITQVGIDVRDDYSVLEGLELRGFHENTISGAKAVRPQNASNVLLDRLLIHDFFNPNISAYGIQPSTTGTSSTTVRNTIIYDGDKGGIYLDTPGSSLTVENCTIYGMNDPAFGSGVWFKLGTMSVTNTISIGNFFADFRDDTAGTISGSHNMSGDATGSTVFAGDLNAITGATSANEFMNDVVATADLHLAPSALAIGAASDLSGSFCCDIDFGIRNPASGWDMGADEFAATTAVELTAFEALGDDTNILLKWETGSELENLGFHLHRSTGPDGSYERITARAIPGLGSSPAGARYQYRDTNLVNGVMYYYQLEDIDTHGKSTFHGPVAAAPTASSNNKFDNDDDEATITYGDPSANELQTTARGTRSIRLVLDTRGFYADTSEDGSVHIEIPEFVDSPGADGFSTPVRRIRLPAVAGRNVKIVSVRAKDVVTIEGLSPRRSVDFDVTASEEGIVRTRRRREDKRGLDPSGGLQPSEPARVVSVEFQGDAKKALVELAPLRWNAARKRWTLAKRLVVVVAFTGRAPNERSTDGVRGRLRRRGVRAERRVIAQLKTRAPGLYGVAYDEIFSRGRTKAVPSDRLALTRRGRPVAYHLEPKSEVFERGSTLYFVSAGEEANPNGREAVYELELGVVGSVMATLDSDGSGRAPGYYWAHLEREENRYFQPSLVDAPELWLWEVLFAPETKRFEFELSGLVAASAPSSIEIRLQGVSDLPRFEDHHVRVAVNSTVVGQGRWNGKFPETIRADLAPGVLRQGINVLELTNVGDTGAAYSMVMLDQFRVRYPRLPDPVDGKIEGEWSAPGTVSIAGVDHAVDITDTQPRWVRASAREDGGLELAVAPEHRYLMVSAASVLEPDVTKASKPALRSRRNRADYLVIGPRNLLAATRPLLAARREQGLRTKAVPIESIYEQFGFGEASPEAIRDFLSFAYHQWRAPSPRYVLLVGDATYDPKDYLGTGAPALVPSLSIRTPYLWTVSDLRLAAVNGEDDLPDMAIGRLPVKSPEQVEAIVAKILAYETGRANLASTMVLVADNADDAGSFEADAEALSRSVMSGRHQRKIYLSATGSPSATRASILEAFDSGASVMSYLGHGGIHLWADEVIFSTKDIDALGAQAQQPILLTMNCLNGYFQFPYFDSLAEGLLKPSDKGVIAAISPSGLSSSKPAQRYHQVLLAEILSGRHSRLGDAVLAAQATYADSGGAPQLIDIYHLFGDPALGLKR